MVSVWTCSLVPTTLKATSAANLRQVKTYATCFCCLLCQGVGKMHHSLRELPVLHLGSKETAQKQSSAWESWSLPVPGQCGATEHQWYLCGILSQDESMLCSFHQAGVEEHGLQTAEALKPGFLGMHLCAYWCSALMSNKMQAQVKVSPQQSHSQQLFPLPVNLWWPIQVEDTCVSLSPQGGH